MKLLLLKAIETGDFDAMQELLVLSHNVNEVLFALRKNAGIEFAADKDSMDFFPEF